jgi:hypothetical protein
VKWTWGTVTATSPLTVRVDGDTDTTPVDATLVAGLTVGARVRIQIDGLLIVVGKKQ